MKKLPLVLYLIMLVPFCIAEENNTSGNNELVNYYESELFQFDYTMFGGMTLNYKNKSFSFQFGIPENLKDILSTYPDSKEYIDSYSKLNPIGNILLYSGIIIISLTEAFSSSEYIRVYNIPNYEYIVGGIYISCLFSIISGEVIVQISLDKFFQGINTFNRNKMSEYEKN